jgi:outer membrane usher protein
MSLLPPSRRAPARPTGCAHWLLVAVLLALLAPTAHAQEAPPQEGDAPPQEGEAPAPPQEGEPAPPPQEGEPAAPPQEGEPPPQEGEPAPQEGAPAPQEGEPTPRPADGAPTPPPPPPPPRVDGAAPPPDAPPADLLELAPPPVLLAPFTLTVNEVVKGETILALKDGEVFVQPSELEAAGLINVPRGQRSVLEGMEFVLLESIGGLKFELDEHEIVLRLTAPLEMLPASAFDASAKPPDIDFQTPTSMFLNYAVQLTHERNYSAYQELAVSHGGDLMVTTLQMSSVSEPRRGTSSYTINERSKLRRLVLGDAAVNTGVLGSSASLAGWTLSRAYDLDPYLVTRPSLKYLGSTMTPASLDVYINGTRTRSIDLSPGRFELNNLLPAVGAGAATYVLRDVFGNESVVENPYYMSELLSEGRDEFTYSIGVQCTDPTDSWGYERPVLLAAHRYGFTQYLTVGGRMEAAEGVVSAGSSATAAIRFGEMELAAAGSAERDAGAGWATSLGYSYIARQISAGANGSLVSDRYATLTQAAAADRAVRSANVSVSVPVQNWLTTGVSGRYAVMRDRGANWSLDANCNLVMLPGYPINVTGRMSDFGGVRVWQVGATVSFTLRDMHRATAGIMAGSSAPYGTASISKQSNNQTFGYRAETTLGPEVQSFRGAAQYQARVGRYEANYSHSVGFGQLGSVSASGALVVVPGMGLFATVPILDSFGVVSIPGVKDVRVTLNNQDVAKTNRHGNALVPGMLSYYGNRVGLKLEDVPMNYEVRSNEQVVAPPQRGAAIAVFASARPHYYRGSFVIDERGKRSIPDYGQARVLANDGREELAPLGPEGEFELQQVEPGTHRVTIEYVAGTCELELVVPPSEDVVIELGEFVCHRP